jgi:hypothetical protein
MSLNTEQKRASLHKDGPLLLLACPGAGKTRTITSRYIELVKSGVNESNILMLTFTNKAAKEMAFALEVAGYPEAWAEDYPLTVGGTKEEMLRFSSLLFRQDDISAAELFISFWRLVDKECGNPVLILSMYRAKALLNKFRTANGQKEGKYKKIWFEGREDNSFVMAYLKSALASNNGEYPGDDALWQYMTLTYPR